MDHGQYRIVEAISKPLASGALSKGELLNSCPVSHLSADELVNSQLGKVTQIAFSQKYIQVKEKRRLTTSLFFCQHHTQLW